LRRNHYETAVIINAALDDEQIEAVVAKITGIITDGGGEISETEKWGRKRLAYTINKNRIGYYVIYRFEAPVDLIAELERLMKIDESVVRFLTIRLEKEALEYFATRKFEAETLEAESEVAEEEVEEIAVAEEKAEVPAEITCS
jgi:small subunit ribosomal protein S6